MECVVFLNKIAFESNFIDNESFKLVLLRK